MTDYRSISKRCGAYFAMEKDATGLMYFFKRGKLLLRGLIHFGPRRTYLAQKSLSLTLDAFEALYDRLPDQNEQLQLVRKLAWFNEQHNRLPTREEAVQIVRQIEIR